MHTAVRVLPTFNWERTNPARAAFQLAVLGRMIFSCLVDADFNDTEQFYAQTEGREVDRETMLAVLLEEFDGWRARLEGEGFAPVRERWRALSDTLGRLVTVDGITGVAQDLDHDGALLIDVGGTVQRVIAGEIA